MPELDELRLRITIDDKGTPVIRGIRGEIDQTKGKSIAATDAMAKGFSNLWAKIAVGAGAVLAFRNLTQALTGFDTSFRNVTTLITDATFNIAGLEKGLLDLPGEFGDIQTKAEAAYDAISGGVEPANAVEFVGKAAMFAGANVTNLQTSVDLLTTVLNTYGNKAGTVEQIMDQLTLTIQKGKMRGEELAGSYGRIAATANSMGIGFADLNAAIIANTAGGIQASETMSSLKQVIANIAQPTDQAKKAAEGMAGGFSIASMQSQGFAQFLRNLTEHTKGNVQAQKDLFGSVEAFNAIAILTSENGLKRFEEALLSLKGAHDVTKVAFDKQQESFTATYNAIKNDLTAAFVQSLLPALKYVAAYFRENREEIVGFVKTVVGGIGETIKIIVSMKDVIILAGKAWLTYFAITKINAVFNAFTAGTGVINQVVVGFVNLKQYGLSTMDSFKGAFRTATGEAFSFGSAIKKIPTSVKITVALMGAELVGRVLAYLFDEISRVHDRGMVKIIEETEKTTGVTGKLNQEIANFVRMGETHKKVVEEIKKTLEFYGYTTDNSTQYVKRLHDLLGQSKEWKEWQENLKNAGAGVKNLSISLEENQLVYKDLVKTIGNYTQTELDSLVTQGMITETQKGKLLELQAGYKENQKVIQEQQKATEDLASQTRGAQLAQATSNTELQEQLDLQAYLNEQDFDKYMEELGKAHLEAAYATYEQQKALLDLNIEMKTAIERSILLSNAYNSLSGGISNQLMSQFDNLELGISGMSAAISGKGSLIDGFKGFAVAGDSAAQILGSLGIVSDKTVKHISDLTKGVSDLALGIASGNPFQMIAGGIQTITTLFDIFKGKSGELKAAERILQGLGDAAAGYADEIEKLAKELDKAGGAEEAFNSYFDDIIKDTTITTHNIDTFLAKIKEMPAVAQWGSASWDQVSKDYDNAIMAILEDTQRLGKEGSRQFTDLIRNARDLGLELEGVSDYIGGVLNTGVESWKNYVTTLDTTSIGENFAFVEQTTISLISALKSEGKSIQEIIGMMGPQFSDLAQLVSASGLQVSAGLQQMLDISQFTTAHKELYDRITATVGIMDALGDSVYVVDKDFYGFSTQVQQQFAEIIALTGNQNLALQLMTPSLSEIIDLSEGHGFVIDQNTQALIDQAKEAGISLEAQKSGTELLNDTLGDTNIILLQMAKALGADIPDALLEKMMPAFDRMGNSATGHLANMTGQLGHLQDSISDTVDRIGTMEGAIQNVDREFVNAITGNTMTKELKTLRDEIGITTAATLGIGNAIVTVHSTWVNSSAEMQEYLTGIQDRIKELEKTIGEYGEKLSEEKAAEKAANEAEMEQLQGILDAREKILGVSEELSSIVFDTSSFETGIQSIYGVYNALHNGLITTKEAMNEVGASFNTMIEEAQRLGMEGSASILNLMKSTRQAGLNVPEISKYIGAQLTGGAGALGDYLGTFTGTGAIKEKIKELEESLVGTRGKKRAEILIEITQQNTLLSASFADVGANFQSMSTYTLGFFNSMIAEGATFMEAMKAMGPQFSDLAKIARDNGMQVGGALREMLDIQGTIDQYPELMTRIDTTTKMLESLGNSGYLTFDLLKQFQADTISQFDTLVAKTGNVDQAYQLLAPQLGKMLWYSQQQGLQLDANTKALIVEAQQHGINMAAMIPPEEKIVELLKVLVTTVGGEIPEALQTMSTSATENFQTIQSGTQSFQGAVKAAAGEAINGIIDPIDLMSERYEKSLGDMGARTEEMKSFFGDLGKNIEGLPEIKVMSNITDLTGSTQVEFSLIQEAATFTGETIGKFAGDSVGYIQGIGSQIDLLNKNFEGIPGYTEYARSAIESFAPSAVTQIGGINTQMETLYKNFTNLASLSGKLSFSFENTPVEQDVKAATGFMGWVNSPMNFLAGEGGEKEYVSIIPESRMKNFERTTLPEPILPRVYMPTVPMPSPGQSGSRDATKVQAGNELRIEKIVISPTIVVQGGDSERDLTEKWLNAFKKNTYLQKETTKIIARKIQGELNA